MAKNSRRVPRTILLALGFAAPVFALALIRTNIWLALAPLFVSNMLQLYATLVVNCEWWGPVISSFATDAREVWITIDDGPSADTPRLLDALDRFEARATFFVIGERAEAQPHFITEILARGHEIANHTFTHPAGTFWCAGPRSIAREIARGAEPLRSKPDRPARLFRAPAGMKNPFVHPILQQRGLQLVGWSARAFDTMRRNAGEVARAIAKRAKPGGIILLHDRRRESDPDYYLRCLELTLQTLSDAGYRCVIPRDDQISVGKI